jgi:hypothetical protein
LKSERDIVFTASSDAVKKNYNKQHSIIMEQLTVYYHHHVVKLWSYRDSIHRHHNHINQQHQRGTCKESINIYMYSIFI